MKKKYMVRWALAAVVILIANSPVSIVLASSPIMQVFDVNDTHPAPRFSKFCGYPVMIHEEGRIKDIYHIDQNGDFVMESLTGENVRITFINAQTGQSLTSVQTGLILYQVDGAFAAGVTAHFHIPGDGVVMLDAGKFAFDADGNLIFEAGPHDYIDGNWQSLCDALR